MMILGRSWSTLIHYSGMRLLDCRRLYPAPCGGRTKLPIRRRTPLYPWTEKTGSDDISSYDKGRLLNGAAGAEKNRDCNLLWLIFMSHITVRRHTRWMSSQVKGLLALLSLSGIIYTRITWLLNNRFLRFFFIGGSRFILLQFDITPTSF